MDTLICLDIDGTITEDKFSVPEKTTKYLQDLSERGYPIFFETGRSFSFAMRSIEAFDFPHFISPQNGSVILQMPEKKLLFKKYLDRSHLNVIEDAFSDYPSDFIIYSGYEKDDICFYRKKNFSNKQLDYIASVQDREHASWTPVDNFSDGMFSSFPLIKGFGPLKEMEHLRDDLNSSSHFQVSINKDPFVEDCYLLLITHKEVSKGSALLALKDKLGVKRVIAAGDDDNDKSMLLKADTKIVIDTASQELKDLADIIAARPNEYGIINALNEAL
jgi:Cof subfamily protein (haloacid dehalogenase superfamily)